MVVCFELNTLLLPFFALMFWIWSRHGWQSGDTCLQEVLKFFAKQYATILVIHIGSLICHITMLTHFLLAHPIMSSAHSMLRLSFSASSINM
jgi:hypothetical protein